VNEFLQYAIMLYLVIVAYIQFVILLIELKRITESLNSRTKVFVYQDYHSRISMNCTKSCGCESVTFLLH